jgi:salicylate hydroxylase
MARALRVAVIGGGIGGLAAARALLLRGMEVTVYEQAPRLSEFGATGARSRGARAGRRV